MRAVARELGVPLAEDKCEGPTTKLTFLGIEIDTISGALRLPQEKLERLNGTLAEWVDRRWCWRRVLSRSVAPCFQGSPTRQGIFTPHLQPTERGLAP